MKTLKGTNECTKQNKTKVKEKFRSNTGASFFANKKKSLMQEIIFTIILTKIKKSFFI